LSEEVFKRNASDNGGGGGDENASGDKMDIECNG
jgi:hypothetical protein